MSGNKKTNDSGTSNTRSSSNTSLFSLSRRALSVSTLKTLASETNIESILQRKGLNIIKQVGEGEFAKVFLAESLHEKRMKAVKVFNLINNKNAVWVKKCLKNELFISKRLKHPNIILTEEVFKTNRFGVIVMQYAENGTLKRFLFTVLRRPCNSDEARRFFSQLMYGLQHMHNRNIAHRDLKLENFLLSADQTPMISDFGFAAMGSRTMIVQSQLLKGTQCGSFGYMAPEIFAHRPYDAKSVDIFAMGVCLFEMLHLCFPFVDKFDIRKVKFNPNLDHTVKNLIESMLALPPNQRPKVDEVLDHQWVCNGFLNKLINVFQI